MRTTLNTPTETRIYSNFRNTKRIKWSEHRHYGH